MEKTVEKKERNDLYKKRKKCDKFWRIDKHMLPYTIHFFLYIGAMGALLPYHPPIGITRLNLGAADLAVVFTVQQFLFIVSKPIVGYITDYFNNLKKMIIVLTVINAVLSYLLLAIPKVHNISNISHMNESLLKLQHGYHDFCKICSISNDLQKMLEYLPKSKNISATEIYCLNKYITRETFNVQCTNLKINSSLRFNKTCKIAVDTCHTPMKESQNSNISNINNVNKSSLNVYIRMYGHQISDQDSTIVCPISKKISKVKKLNFNLNYISRACYECLNDEILEDLYSNSTSHLEFSYEITCDDSDLNGHDKNITIESDSVKTYQFWLYTLLLIGSCTCTSCIFTLSDTACYESAQTTGADYGQQRAWGAVGWGLFAPLAGILNDYSNGYWPSMILMTILCVVQIWNLSKLELVKPQFPESIFKDVKTVLSSRDFITFAMGVFFNGMGIGIVWFFLAWYIIDIGGTSVVIGFAHTIQSFLGEMPFMFISGTIIKRIGHSNVVSVALLATSVRFLAYSYLTNPWMILPVECLDGITFGLFYAAMTSYGKLNAKPGTEATTQSLLCSTYEGLGAGLGCVISGICFDYYGGHRTFFYGGICFAVAAAIKTASSSLLSFKKGSIKVSRETDVKNIRY